MRMTYLSNIGQALERFIAFMQGEGEGEGVLDRCSEDGLLVDVCHDVLGVDLPRLLTTVLIGGNFANPLHGDVTNLNCKISISSRSASSLAPSDAFDNTINGSIMKMNDYERLTRSAGPPGTKLWTTNAPSLLNRTAPKKTVSESDIVVSARMKKVQHHGFALTIYPNTTLWRIHFHHKAIEASSAHLVAHVCFLVLKA